MDFSISRPSLIIRKDTCLANIQRMAAKAKSSGTIFRPHFKTHQSTTVGNWFREAGIDQITVSSLSMAKEFANGGWNDITIAFPANLLEAKEYNELAGRIKLNLIVDAPEVISGLAKIISNPTGIFIEIDNGYSRSGTPYDDHDKIDKLYKLIIEADHLNFKGFINHAGNTYAASGENEIKSIYADSIKSIQILKKKYPEAMISVGDTPSCSIIDDLGDADEIRPGNFVYYDLMQYYLGSCSFDDIAVSVACPVAGIYPERDEIVIYGGAVHLSKEYADKGGKHFGLIVRYTKEGWSLPLPGARLISLSQEHGIIKMHRKNIQTSKHGDIIGVIPIHSCLTANLLRDNYLII